MNADGFRSPIDMSNAGARAALLDGLPRDVGGLAKVVQGLLIHEHIAPAYGVTLSAEQHAQAHMRGVEKMLDCIAQPGQPAVAAGASARRARGRRLPALHAAACRHAAPAGNGGSGTLRLRRLLREGQVHRPLGHGILERGRAALGAGRCPARPAPARAVRYRLRSARRAARPVPGGGRRLAALPQRQGRSWRVRYPRHARIVVHRRQRHPRRGRAQ